MMIGGAVTFVLGIPLLLAEAAQVSAPRTQGVVGRFLGALAITVCGIPFAFLMEFDLGVPQFPAVTQFVIFAFLAAWIGCAVRLWLGPGGALLVAGPARRQHDRRTRRGADGGLDAQPPGPRRQQHAATGR
jgi:hypothetical protein